MLFTYQLVPELGWGHKGRLINPSKTSARIIELINNPAERKMLLVREQRRLPCKQGVSVPGGGRAVEASGAALPTVLLRNKMLCSAEAFDDWLEPFGRGQ